MLGITYHNPATISVFLDRMRFRDCFISNDEMRKGEWARKLKSFVDLPSDGRDRVVFVESFATLQALLQNGAVLDTVKVAVYDDCSVLASVPGASIVDAHINGGSTDTWQLYTVSFEEFNDALAAQPQGVPALIRDHDAREDDDIPEPPPVTREAADDEDDEDEAEEQPKKHRSVLVMEQLLDDIERDDEDEDEDSEPEVSEPERLPEAAIVAEPKIARGRILIPKGGGPRPPPVETEVEEPEAEPEVSCEPEPEPEPPPVEPEPEPPKKQKRKRSKKPEPPKSYTLF